MINRVVQRGAARARIVVVARGARLVVAMVAEAKAAELTPVAVVVVIAKAVTAVRSTPSRVTRHPMHSRIFNPSKLLTPGTPTC